MMIEGRWEVIRLGLADEINLHFIDRDTEGYHPEKQFLAPVGRRSHRYGAAPTHSSSQRSLRKKFCVPSTTTHLSRVPASSFLWMSC